MGLSGRREKQRIPNDPRNLSWADNATKFGQSYLSKLGWDPSKGLGVAGDGRTSHIKVSQKLDMLGIGAANSKDPNGIAWKQNKDFEALLRRLNDGSGKEDDERREVVEAKVLDEGRGEDNGKRKRKEDSDDSEQMKEKKKRKKEKDAESCSSKTQKTSSSEVVAPRPMAHRARHIASKRLASKSALAISEILGIAPTTSSSSSSSASLLPQSTQMQGTLTQLDDDHTLEKLTTSTKSVADYFKDRLGLKASGNSSSLLSSSDEKDYEVDRAPRLGLGSQRGHGAWEEGQVPTTGLGMGALKFGSLISGAFLASLPAAPAIEDPNTDGPSGEREPEVTEVEEKERKKAKKDKKGKNKRDKKGKGTEEFGEQVRSSDEKDTKSKKDKWRKKNGGELVQEQVQTSDDANATKKSAKEVRKEKAERKAAKKASRREVDSP